MIEDSRIKKILYGGDYNPEQWEEEIWQEDMRILPLGGIDVLTINVFSWALLQPSEDEYNFEKLDKIVKMATDNGFKICFATGTAAHPAWMAKRHPDILRVTKDGMRRNYGGRHNSCPNSPTYAKYSVALARKLAERYGKNENIVAWHVANEFEAACYCEKCAEGFRQWLKKRYGTIDKVNEAWNLNFWSHTLYDFDEINPPTNLSEEWGYHRSTFSGLSIDYCRYQSEAVLNMYRREYEVLKEVTPHIPVTTNLMGTYWPLDYHEWAQYLDFISWDSYPVPTDSYTRTSMIHDIMRGLKQGKPFCLMEQTPSVTNWHTHNALKRPGVMRLLSYQAVAHGADTVMFFQMRRSKGACEKFHGAVIDHCGHENTRVFREIAELGDELKRLGDETLGSRMKSRAAVIWDWNNRWALEYSAGPSNDMDYEREVHRYYAALSKNGVSTDMISVKDDFSKYDILVAPVLYMMNEGIAQRIEEFVKNGGTLVTTYMSGQVDETDRVFGAYPGKLRNVCGVWVEEVDALPPERKNTICITNGDLSGEYSCSFLFETIRSEGAEVIASYGSDFYAGEAAVTKNNFGKGEAWYIGTAAEDAFLCRLFGKLAAAKGIDCIVSDENVETTRRYKNDKCYLFALNHNDFESAVTVPSDCTELLTGKNHRAGDLVTLPKYGVGIFKY